MKTRISCWITAAITMLIGCMMHQGSASAAEVARVQGYAVPIGGALAYDNDEVWSRLVQLAGGKGSRFVVFALAAKDPPRSAARIVQTLQRLGALAEYIPVASAINATTPIEDVKSKELIEKVNNANAVYFAGGAQERIVDTLQPQGRKTPLLEAIWKVYTKGGVVAGSSAGAAIMSQVMFRDAQDVLAVLQGNLREGHEIDRGLGFVRPDLFVDQHFLHRGRIGRMLPLMQAKGLRLGLGVEENTAAIIHGDEIEVVGAKGALLVDLSSSTTDPRLGAFNVRNARIDYLDRGDRVNLTTMQVTPSSEKANSRKIEPHSATFSPYFQGSVAYSDIIGEGVFLTAMTRLLDSAADQITGLAFDPRASGKAPRSRLGFEFLLRKGDDSAGWFTTSLGGEDYTVINIYLDVLPIRLASPLYTRWRSVQP